MHSTLGSYKDLAGWRWLVWLPADRRVQLSLTECWGGVVVVYVGQISQFILPWIDPKILFTWLSGWRPESEGGAAAQSSESRNLLSPADRSEGRGRGPMAGLEMSQLLPTAAAALIYLVVFVRSHNKLTANNRIHIFYIVYLRADTKEAEQWFPY